MHWLLERRSGQFGGPRRTRGRWHQEAGCRVCQVPVTQAVAEVGAGMGRQTLLFRNATSANRGWLFLQADVNNRNHRHDCHDHHAGDDCDGDGRPLLLDGSAGKRMPRQEGSFLSIYSNAGARARRFDSVRVQTEVCRVCQFAPWPRVREFTPPENRKRSPIPTSTGAGFRRFQGRKWQNGQCREIWPKKGACGTRRPSVGLQSGDAIGPLSVPSFSVTTS